MNRFLFGHLPYAMAGAGRFLPEDIQIPQGNMSVMGTTVPQNTWNGMQFNIPKPVEKSAPVPATPPKQKMSTPGGFGQYTPAMFQPVGQLTQGSWAQPAGPAPAGYGWNSAYGYWDPNWGKDSEEPLD